MTVGWLCASCSDERAARLLGHTQVQTTARYAHLATDPVKRATDDRAGERSSTKVPEYVIGWGTLALINAGLAQSKGRSGIGWFLASIVIGPIATFLIVVLGPIERD